MFNPSTLSGTLIESLGFDPRRNRKESSPWPYFFSFVPSCARAYHPKSPKGLSSKTIWPGTKGGAESERERRRSGRPHAALETVFHLPSERPQRTRRISILGKNLQRPTGEQNGTASRLVRTFLLWHTLSSARSVVWWYQKLRKCGLCGKMARGADGTKSIRPELYRSSWAK